MATIPLRIELRNAFRLSVLGESENVQEHERNIVRRLGFRLSAFGDCENVQKHERFISRWLESTPNLVMVHLDKPLATIHEALMNSIRDAVFRNKHVKHLRIDHNKLLPPCGIHLLESLKKLHVTFTGEEVDTSIIAMMLWTHTKGLEELTLEGIRVGDQEAQAVAGSLLTGSSLRKVKLTGRRMTKAGFIALGEALQLQSSLVELEVKQREFLLDGDAEVWAQAIKRNTCLEKLIFLPRRMTACCANMILDAMAANQTLKQVTLGSLELDGEGSVAVARVIAESVTLRHLYLQTKVRHGMDDDDKEAFYKQGMDIKPIAQALGSNHSLKTFGFVARGLRADGFRSISNALLQNNTMEALAFGENDMDADGIVPLCLLISQTTTLKLLSLFNCMIDDELLKMLCKSLEQNHSLKLLCLSHNRIGDEGASALADVLSGNTSLTKIKIFHNNISDGGCVSLERALRLNSTLTSLIMTGNRRITERGTRALLNGVRAHPTLTRVELPVTPTDLQKKELDFYLDRNKGPRHLLNANIPLSLWPRALQRANRYGTPDMLYFLVKEKHEELFRNVTGNQKQRVMGRGCTSKRKREETD